MTTTTELLRRAAEGMADLAGHCEQLLPPEESYAAQCRADAASLLTLADQMEPLQRDAERYRFIRDADRSDGLIPHLDLLAMESLDKHIDDAMAQEPKP